MADEKEDKKDEKEETKGNAEETGAEEATAPDAVESPEDLGAKLDIPKVEVMDFETFVRTTFGDEEADNLGLVATHEEENEEGNLEDLPAETDEVAIAGDENSDTTEEPEETTEGTDGPPAV